MPSKDENKLLRFLYGTTSLLICVTIIVAFFIVAIKFSQNSNLLSSGGIIQISPIPCVKIYQQQNDNDGKPVWLDIKKENEKLCLPVSEVMELNNNIKLVESISLLGIFVAIIGVLLPVLGFFSLKQQRETLEAAISENIKDKLAIYKGEFKNVEELINNSKAQIENLPLSILGALKFRQEYLIHRFRRLISTEQGNNDKADDLNNTIHSINSIFAAASQMEYALLNFRQQDDNGVQQIFNIFKDFIPPEDVGSNEPYIQKLKQVLAHFYQVGIFNSDIKRQVLNEFLKEKLNTDPRQWYREMY